MSMQDRNSLEYTIALLQEKEYREKFRKLDYAFPYKGQYAREFYPKHLEFFAAGKDFHNRAIIAANQVGKSFAAGYETVLHATGLYPEWWEGHRFTSPPHLWCVGQTTNSTRDAVQATLLGDLFNPGTGLIPKDLIIKTTAWQGIAGAVLDVFVKHFNAKGKEDGVSHIEFKCCEQGQSAMMGPNIDGAWIDEEPHTYGIYSEILTRTVRRNGIIYCTFTPLKGISEVVLSYLKDGKAPPNHVGHTGKWVTQIEWNDLPPHLSEEAKERLLADYSPHERDARTKGTPALGSGSIYPISEDEITYEPFEIPSYWRRAYGMDVGWNNTASIWAAQDPSSKVWYIYHEYKRGKAEPSIHAEGIKGPGKWIPGVCDPAAGGSNQKDGTRLIDEYKDLGLDIRPADNSVEAGILKVYQGLSSQKIRIAKHLYQTLSEYRLYRRDENGKVVKINDHLMDALRYLVMSGLDIAIPFPEEEDQTSYHNFSRNSITGY